jgi:hypothetical protein
MKSIRLIASLAAIAAMSACAPRREAPPAPEPAPPVRQAPPPRPSPPPPPAPGWEDAQLTPGGWTLRAQGEAAFGPAGGEALFTVRCDRAARRVTLTRQGSGNGPLVVRTSTAARTLPVAAPALSAALSVGDPLLDAMVFSRGRFAVEAPGLPRLVIPAWPEPARVIEDCRG